LEEEMFFEKDFESVSGGVSLHVLEVFPLQEGEENDYHEEE
jgi:hypothetical protein